MPGHVRRAVRRAVVGALVAIGVVVAAAAPAASAPAADGVVVVIADDGITVIGQGAHDALEPDGGLVEPRSFSQCFAGNVCVWEGSSYSGKYAGTASTAAVTTGITTAASYANRSTKAARLYSGTGGTGSSACLSPGEQSGGSTIPAASMRILTVTSC
jgi:hypothetical protein